MFILKQSRVLLLLVLFMTSTTDGERPEPLSGGRKRGKKKKREGSKETVDGSRVQQGPRPPTPDEQKSTNSGEVPTATMGAVKGFPAALATSANLPSTTKAATSTGTAASAQPSASASGTGGDPATMGSDSKFSASLATTGNFTPSVSTAPPKDSRPDEHPNRFLSAAVAVFSAVFWNAPARNAVLEIDPDSAQLDRGRIKDLYSVIDRFSIDRPSSCQLMEKDIGFFEEKTANALEMYESVVEFITSNLPVIPRDVLSDLKLEGTARSEAAAKQKFAYENQAIKIKSDLRFSKRASKICSCENPQPIRSYETVLDSIKGLRSLKKEFDEKKLRCDKCNSAPKVILSEFGTVPTVVTITGAKEVTLSSKMAVMGMPHFLHGALVEKKTTGLFSFLLVKEKDRHLDFSFEGRRILSDSVATDMLNGEEYRVIFIQMKTNCTSPPLSPKIVSILEKMADAPARIKNVLGNCAIIASGNILMMLPQKLRRDLKRLQVPDGERPALNFSAGLYSLLSSFEETVERQRQEKWKEASEVPTNLTAAKDALEWTAPVPGNHLHTINTTFGATCEEIFVSLFNKLKKRAGFREFAQYNVFDPMDETAVEGDPFLDKELNVVVLPKDETTKRTPKTVKEIFSLWQPGFYVGMILVEPGHSSALGILPCGKRLYVSDERMEVVEEKFDAVDVEVAVVWKGTAEKPNRQTEAFSQDWTSQDPYRPPKPIEATFGFDFSPFFYIQWIQRDLVFWKTDFTEALIFRKGDSEYVCTGKRTHRCTKQLPLIPLKQDLEDLADSHKRCWKVDKKESTRALFIGGMKWNDVVRRNIDLFLKKKTTH